MSSRIFATFSLALALFLSGCSTVNQTNMAFINDTDKVLDTGKPIFLMTITLRNTYKDWFQPKPKFVFVEKTTVKDAANGINFAVDDKAESESDKPTEVSTYLLRMELEKGEYVIRGISSMVQVAVSSGFYFAPLHAKLTSSEPGVYYIGHIEATIRERKDTEFKAGPSIPLLDQAISGASTGTFDIEISDQWDRDGPKFQSKFPMLSAVSIHKDILPPFDRAKAQQWWETH